MQTMSKVNYRVKVGDKFAVKNSTVEIAKGGKRYILTTNEGYFFDSPFLAKDAAGYFHNQHAVVEDNAGEIDEESD